MSEGSAFAETRTYMMLVLIRLSGEVIGDRTLNSNVGSPMKRVATRAWTSFDIV